MVDPRRRSNTSTNFTREEVDQARAGAPGDIFSCGTCGGVGQGTNSFLKIGDVMETEVESLGKMRNRFVAETA